ncbi:hypothetical protein A2Z33_01420 [Candidatus Gottesmanbacteria bacterium RBG_16_52_11]|uniref:Uncharacterized protein n=1 Tax=Candidatus Gottesmanbacteria bacterium RBG_16_52_11 TaxID=1798374 RepID=A0A1F5YNU4_9BACT|nr:MAG: hypothetical protein A2Z33_01420 [Candidatus Gottesmanbacteria bacterium RBG_16_52_11]
MKKGTAMLLFMASVGFILIAIVFSAIIDSTRKSPIPDNRARATQTSSTLEFLGSSGGFDESLNALIVSDLQFADTKGKPLGTFNVIVPGKFNPGSFPAGTSVRITAIPSTFKIAEHVLTAKEIRRN